MAVSSTTEADSTEPMESLRMLIERGKTFEPTSAPPARREDPVATIRDWISAEADELGSAGGGDELSADVEGAPASSGVSTTTSSIPEGVEAALGRAVLEMVAEEPLSAQARTEAVRLIAEAMRDPSEDALRRVLRILIRG